MAYVVLFFFPKMLGELFPQLPTWAISLIAVVPIFSEILIAPAAAAWAERGVGHRRHVMLTWLCPLFTSLVICAAGGGLVISTRSDLKEGQQRAAGAVSLALFVGGVMLQAFLVGTYWALLHAITPAPLRPCSVAVANSIGNLGGFVGPYLLGLLPGVLGPACPARTPSCVGQYGWALVVLGAGLNLIILSTGAMALHLRFYQ